MQKINVKQEDPHCGIPTGCARVVPAWKIALDNLPVAVMFILGAALIWPLSSLAATVFLAYCALSIVLFWALICPYCHHFDTKACPCGYGMASPKYFRPRHDREFKKVFKQNIAVMYPCWLFPFMAGIYRLYAAYTRPLVVLFLSFCIIGFILIPLIAKLVGCRNCEMKADCPWMS